METNKKGGEEMENTNNYIERSSHNFAMILYPDEDIGHSKVFTYLENHKFQFDMLYIDHKAESIQSESEEEHEECKPHRHVLIRTRAKYTTKGLLKFFSPYLKHVVKVSSVPSYVMYMRHDTIASENKIQYDISDLHGSKDLIREAYDIRNLHFIQLAEFADDIEKGTTISSLVKTTAQEENEDLQKVKIDTINKYQYLMVAMGQEQRSKELLSVRKSELEIQNRTFKLHTTGEI